MSEETAGYSIIFLLSILAIGFVGISIYNETTCKDSVKLMETYSQTKCGPGGKGSIVNINGSQYLQCECPRENK